MGYDDRGDGDSDQASFNDAATQIKRIDEYYRRIADSKLNPFAVNPERGIMNYQLRDESLGSLWGEVRPLCTNKEIEFIDNVRRILEEQLETIPLIETIESSKGQFNSINYLQWKVINKLMLKLEEQIRKLAHLHGLGNPAKRKDRAL